MGNLVKRNVARIGAVENLTHLVPERSTQFCQIRRVSHQSSDLDKISIRIHCGKAVFCDQSDDRDAVGEMTGAIRYNEGIRPVLLECREDTLVLRLVNFSIEHNAI